MKYFISTILSSLFSIIALHAQDTFSIVALDSVTRQVGSAGASCLDLYTTIYTDPSFLGDLLPDTGAINTQSYFIQANQDNARAQMRSGSSAQQIINWLVANDAIANPEFKQYGIVGFNGSSAQAAAHTGSSCISYKNHITGNIKGMYYAIQGNILKGQEILDSMESKFRNTNGTLACRMMAAMQGANVVGADTRCNSENTSSLFAFLKVALPTDPYGQPSLNISLKTAQGAGIEPIDSLQKMFDNVNGCSPLSVSNLSGKKTFKVYPNPAHHTLHISSIDNQHQKVQLSLSNTSGQIMLQKKLEKNEEVIDIRSLQLGLYFYKFHTEGSLLHQGELMIE